MVDRRMGTQYQSLSELSLILKTTVLRQHNNKRIFVCVCVYKILESQTHYSTPPPATLLTTELKKNVNFVCVYCKQKPNPASSLVRVCLHMHQGHDKFQAFPSHTGHNNVSGGEFLIVHCISNRSINITSPPLSPRTIP